jgi:hypothetical protein
LILTRTLKHFLGKSQTTHKLYLFHTILFSKPIFTFITISHRLESGGSNTTTSDSYGDRASARARREAREARLASLTSRVEEDSNRDYKKVGFFGFCFVFFFQFSCSWFIIYKPLSLFPQYIKMIILNKQGKKAFK